MGFRFVPTVAGEFAGFEESAGREGVWKATGVCFTGVRMGIGDDDGGKMERDCTDEGAAKKRLSSSSGAKILDRGRVAFSLRAMIFGDEKKLSSSSSSKVGVGSARRLRGEGVTG